MRVGSDAGGGCGCARTDFEASARCYATPDERRRAARAATVVLVPRTSWRRRDGTHRAGRRRGRAVGSAAPAGGRRARATRCGRGQSPEGHYKAKRLPWHPPRAAADISAICYLATGVAQWRRFPRCDLAFTLNYKYFGAGYAQQEIINVYIGSARLAVVSSLPPARRDETPETDAGRTARAGARAARTKSDHTTSVVTSLLTHHNSSRGTHTSHHMRTTRAAAPAGPRLGDARAVRCIEYTTSSSSCLAYRQSPSAATPTHIANVSSSSTESSISASSRGYSRIRADSAASPRHGRRVDCRQHPSHRRLPKPR